MNILDRYISPNILFSHSSLVIRFYLFDSFTANFNNFIPTFSEGMNTYPIRNPQRQIPKHSHEYIKQICRYQMTIVINEIYSNSGKYHNTVIFNTIENAANIPLASFKTTIKSYFLGEYSFFCNPDNCYICQS